MQTSLPVLNTQKKVEVAPGEFIASGLLQAPGEMVPKWGIVELLPMPGGLYKAVLRTHDDWQRVSRANLRKLKVEIEYRTFVRLIDAGFIKGRRPAPGTRQFSLKSLAQHLSNVETDPFFWDGPKRRSTYMAAINNEQE